ncbi:MAG TPA: methyltransferase domain-containing protein [Puia sp.]|nr:methyltransferase domain-containing protein [Puia sp.]
MKIVFASFFFCLIYHNAFSQKLIKVEGHCGLYCKSMEQVEKQFRSQVQFYDFHLGETISSVGASCANWEAVFASLSDSVAFYLEDIDSGSLNSRQVDFAWEYYSKLGGKAVASSHTIVIGNDTSTNLPDSFFDKILIINSFHEFSNQEQMLKDISKKLKPNGVLFIDETLAKKSGELHVQCKKRIYTDAEMIAIFKNNGFAYTKSIDMSFRDSKPVRKIFAFRKA